MKNSLQKRLVRFVKFTCRVWCPERTCGPKMNGLRDSVLETLVLKTRSDRVGRKRWTRTKSQLWWKFISDGQRNPGNSWYVARNCCSALKRHWLCEQNGWVPYELSDKNLQQRSDTCNLLLEKNKEHPILKKMITRDEKWIVHNNVKRKREPKNSCPQTAAKGI